MIGQELITKPDERKEALDYDKLSFGVFKPEEEEHEMNISDDLGLVEQVEVYCTTFDVIQDIYFLR